MLPLQLKPTQADRILTWHRRARRRAAKARRAIVARNDKFAIRGARRRGGFKRPPLGEL